MQANDNTSDSDIASDCDSSSASEYLVTSRLGAELLYSVLLSNNKLNGYSLVDASYSFLFLINNKLLDIP